MAEPRPVYEHRQTAVFMRVTFALVSAVLLALYAAPPAEQRVLLIVAPLFLLLFLTFDGLTIRIAGGELRWAFGVFGFPRGRLALADIAEATATRTTFWEGWGIRYTRRGWLYNVSGFDAVLIRRTGGKTFLLGTDEPRKLVAAIESAKRNL
ncbi:MAG: hypothetical protein L6Q72_00055 [Burkholderiaceae bacterium]|nr:hypothetical protein [Burkholderiaceae bacterium]